MGQRAVTSAAREAGATIVAMLLALGVGAVLATLLALATIMAVMLDKAGERGPGTLPRSSRSSTGRRATPPPLRRPL